MKVIVMAGGPGFEPGLSGSEPLVLPLNYPPKQEEGHHLCQTVSRNDAATKILSRHLLLLNLTNGTQSNMVLGYPSTSFLI